MPGDCRIREVIAHPLSAPLRRPLYTAHEVLQASTVVLVEVLTEDGLKGYGLVHGSPLKDVAAWVTRLGELVRGMDALAHEAVWDRLFALTSPRPGAVLQVNGQTRPLPRSARPQVLAALGGIDIALWDIKGKAAGLPVYRLLGGEARPVFTYATGGYYTAADEPVDAAAAELAAYVADGFRAVKLKTGTFGVEREAERVAAVREAIGPHVQLMLDLNAAYDLNDCIRFARLVEPYNVFWLEEPLHWYLQPVDYVRLAEATTIPLSHGERELHRYTVRDFITCGAIRYLQFDSTRASGFTEALRVAHMAEQHGVYIVPHHAPELHAHLVAAFPHLGYCVESHGSDERDPVAHHLFTVSAERRGAYVHLNDRPGFGFEIDWDGIAPYRLQ